MLMPGVVGQKPDPKSAGLPNLRLLIGAIRILAAESWHLGRAVSTQCPLLAAPELVQGSAEILLFSCGVIPGLNTVHLDLRIGDYYHSPTMKSLQQLTRHKAFAGLATPRILPSRTIASAQLWQRKFSASVTAASQLPALDASKLTVTTTTTPKELTPNKDLVFGKTFTGMNINSDPAMRIADLDFILDHMLSIEWTATDGWQTPQIIPYQNLSLDPSTCVFHYAFECFEGMKAYKDKNGGIRLFRPNKNMERLNKSSARIALPTFDGEALTKLIGEFVKLDNRFIPESVAIFLVIMLIFC